MQIPWNRLGIPRLGDLRWRLSRKSHEVHENQERDDVPKGQERAEVHDGQECGSSWRPGALRDRLAGPEEIRY